MFAPSQWETSLQSNTVSHSLGANLQSALHIQIWVTKPCIELTCTNYGIPLQMYWFPANYPTLKDEYFMRVRETRPVSIDINIRSHGGLEHENRIQLMGHHSQINWGLRELRLVHIYFVLIIFILCYGVIRWYSLKLLYLHTGNRAWKWSLYWNMICLLHRSPHLIRDSVHWWSFVKKWFWTDYTFIIH